MEPIYDFYLALPSAVPLGGGPDLLIGEPSWECMFAHDLADPLPGLTIHLTIASVYWSCQNNNNKTIGVT